MKIAIGCPFQFSFFSHGTGQTVLALADALKLHGNEVTLVSTTGSEWWEDIKALKEKYNVLILDKMTEPIFDLFVDLDGYISPERRARVASKSVILCRKPVILFDIEPTIYPLNIGKRDFQGVSAIWMWEHFEESDADYMHLLSGLPVYRVPFIWSPSPLDAHRQETKFPEWSQTVEMIKDVQSWDCHVCETNFSCSSSSTIPMVMISHAKKHADFPISVCNVHSADHIKANEFFMKNVLEHCQVDGLNYTFVGRQRCVDWTVHSKGWVLSHLRFLPIRSYLLDVVWSGIPIVHNSIWLRDMHPWLAELYYPDNSLTEGVVAMKKMVANFEAKTGYFSSGAQQILRKAIIDWISPRFSSLLWPAAINGALNGASFVPSLPSVTPSVPFVPTVPSVPSAPSVPTVPTVTKETDDRPVIKILFTDMWDDFNPQYNFFTLLLQETVKNISPKPLIEGCSQTEKPDLLIFGPFGETWKKYSCPKVFFTGENMKPIEDDSVKLNLTFENTSGPDEKKMRLPLWFMEIDWFGANVEKIVNPKPLPLDVVCKADTDMIKAKDKFCAFVVTNPMNQVRNDAFAWLSMYKYVDSAGRLFNNCDDVIFAGRGGGGGELLKHEFLKKYKFCLAYENQSANGYTTEKILHAKAAGCVPIYWGDPEIGRDFDIRGFLNAQACASPEELIDLVKSVDCDDAKYEQMTKLPALDPYRRDLIRRRLSEIGRKLIGLASGKDYVASIPRFLGATTSEEAKGLAFARNESADLKAEQKVIEVTDNILDSVVVATYASKNFFASLQQWLDSYSKFLGAIKNLRAHVFLNKDVAEVSAAYLKKEYPFATFEYVPAEAPDTFPDMWATEHFAWKIWCYKTLANLETYKNCIIWYTDAGSISVRWPMQYLALAKSYGVCVLEDGRQKNDQWCQESMRGPMNVTADELADQQIVGGLMALLGCDKRAIAFYEDAWTYAQRRECVAGPKWAGVLADGRPFGHRHDQSIMSILSLRHKLPRYPLDRIYCDKSLRKTFKSGCAVYVHRGNFVSHNNFTERISEAHVINLDRRSDRYEKFLTNHDWAVNVERFSACEGKNMTLSPNIARLLAPNDFMWKKAIAGCAMSHLKLWHDLANEPAHIENYLIMEDDARFEKDWIKGAWAGASQKIPEDYDVLYLGGVLPPNRPVFYGLLEQINESWARVGPNQIFGQREPNRYFHFCNYAYILRREAAVKLIKSIEESGGYTTSADHMICNKVGLFNHYVIVPQVAGCYQDDDPKYQSSEFNNFNRVDGFDSDLWNNDERFESADVIKGQGLDLNIGAALLEAFPLPQVFARFFKPEIKDEVVKKPRLRALVGCEPKMANVLERRWLSELFDGKVEMIVDSVNEDSILDGTPLFIVQRPHTEKYNYYFSKYEAMSKPFKVVHLSDEFINDPIDFYKFSMCKGVLRNYCRPDANGPNVLTIPLGYNKHSESKIDAPWIETPSLPFREQTWTFYGTGWQGRSEALAPLSQIKPSRSKFYKDWLSADQLPELEYISETLNSVFIPCPTGMNPETFRIYEALENGAIPLIVKSDGDEMMMEMLKGNLSLLNIPSWEHATMLIANLMNDKQMLEMYRNQLLVQWAQWKGKLKSQVAAILDA
jgi:GR25 family glycosyltransferase involved in LPS biosynthesis